MNSPPTVGYFARLAPEKGLREFVRSGTHPGRRHPEVQFLAGGDLQPHWQSYWDNVRQLAAPLGDRFQYVGSPETVLDKSALLQQFDLLSVPAPYHEPKGLYVLEAWANGVPVIQPAHGHFPELIEENRRRECVPPGDATALADAWDRMLSDESRRLAAAEAAGPASA